MKESNFSSRLSMFRQNKNMTQEELAGRMGSYTTGTQQMGTGTQFTGYFITQGTLPDIRNQRRRFIGDRKSENNRKRKWFGTRRNLAQITKLFGAIGGIFGKDLVPAFLDGTYQEKLQKQEKISGRRNPNAVGTDTR